MQTLSYTISVSEKNCEMFFLKNFQVPGEVSSSVEKMFSSSDLEI
jgi:hypothetical protein